MKLVLSIVCLLIAAFCVFGFLATFEPGVKNAVMFRLVYGVVGLGCLASIFAMALGSLRSLRKRHSPNSKHP